MTLTPMPVIFIFNMFMCCLIKNRYKKTNRYNPYTLSHPVEKERLGGGRGITDCPNNQCRFESLIVQRPPSLCMYQFPAHLCARTVCIDGAIEEASPARSLASAPPRHPSPLPSRASLGKSGV